jgi:hypothetical protein
MDELRKGKEDLLTFGASASLPAKARILEAAKN